MQIEFDHPTRGRHYRLANEQYPRARAREIQAMLDHVDALPGEHIVELGCGTGVLTRHLAERVGARGRIHALDNSVAAVSALTENVPARHVDAQVLTEEWLPLADRSADAIVTLANFHHISDPQNMFLEIRRVLKPDGRLIIGDVADETPVQRFFDEAVDRFCSTGHRHEFLNPARAWTLCQNSGMEFSAWDLEYVPWEFASEVDAQRFIHKLFDAICPPEECLKDAKRILGIRHDGPTLLNWQLFFMTARKRMSVDAHRVAERYRLQDAIAD